VWHNLSYSRRQGGGYEGRRGHGKGFKRYPVELGEELEVDIAELSPKNEGIDKVQGYVINIPNAKPGDHVKIKITKVGDKTANAQIVNR
jgi:predicted RNA-binding protein with TRAM domain